MEGGGDSNSSGIPSHRVTTSSSSSSSYSVPHSPTPTTRFAHGIEETKSSQDGDTYPQDQYNEGTPTQSKPPFPISIAQLHSY